jgi:ParB-like chromosome segregation protein Spo0J
MRLESISLTKLIPYARNARTHSETQVSQIAGSIREFGFTNPVLIDDENGIIAGHGRVLAARALGMDDVPCIRLSHLTETQRRAYVLADNRIALNSGWDVDMLALELTELKLDDFDLTMLGFDVPELDKLLNGHDEPPESQTQEVDVDAFQMECRCPRCGFEFDPKQTAARDESEGGADE